MGNRRLHERLPNNSQIHLCWPDRQGAQRRLRARALNVSKFGMLVESEVAVAPRTVIFLQTVNFAALGKAGVRHCTPKGLKYEIGLYTPDRPALSLALQETYRQSSAEVVSMRGTYARHESDVEVLRGEMRQHSELTCRQLEELSAQLELHQQEYSRLKSIVSELGSRMAVWCARMDRQGDVLRSLCELQAQRMATVEQLLDVIVSRRDLSQTLCSRL